MKQELTTPSSAKALCGRLNCTILFTSSFFLLVDATPVLAAMQIAGPRGDPADKPNAHV